MIKFPSYDDSAFYTLASSSPLSLAEQIFRKVIFIFIIFPVLKDCRKKICHF